MGRPKALLPHTDGRTTFVAHVIRTSRAAGVERIIVVARPDDEALKEEVAREGASLVLNTDPDRGQLSSLLVGLDAAEREHHAASIMVIPVDVPLISAGGLRILLDRAALDASPIVRAAAGGRHGHPVIFKRAVFEELRAADPELGAKAVVRADPARVRDVEIGDPGVTEDVDTPDDYHRAFGRFL
jgi:molybdenum cofactor cytidylyltransferase